MRSAERSIKARRSTVKSIKAPRANVVKKSVVRLTTSTHAPEQRIPRLAIVRTGISLRIVVRGRVRRRSLRFLRNLMLRAAVWSGFVKSAQPEVREFPNLRAHLQSIRLERSLRRGVFSRGRNLKSLGFEVTGVDPKLDKIIVQLLRASVKRGGPFFDIGSPAGEADVVFADAAAEQDYENAADGDPSEVVISEEEAAQDFNLDGSDNPDEWYGTPEGGVVWGEGPLGESDVSFTSEEAGDVIVGSPANIDSVDSQGWATAALLDLGATVVAAEELGIAGAAFVVDSILDWLFE
jgi:hypothetical protein